MKDKTEICPICELIKTGGIFVDAECDKHPKMKPFFKGYEPTFYFKTDQRITTKL